MKLDQFATYAHNETEIAAVKKSLGLSDSEWVEDVVEGLVDLPRLGVKQARSVGRLLFNYTLGAEFEILTYLSGPHWHASNPLFHRRAPFISHYGFHLDEGEPWPDQPECSLVQEMITTSHTNPFLRSNGRQYHYRIHDTRSETGFYTKYIRRLEAVK